MNVSNRVYEISKLISDSKEYVDTDTVFDVMSLYPQVMPKDKEPVKVELSSLYGKYGKKG
jgi:hypothetical protein